MPTTKIQYGTTTPISISLGGVVSSAQMIVGRQSNVIDNSTDQYLDALIYGYVRADGTGPSVFGLMAQLFVFSQDNDAPTYPTYDGTNRLGTTDADVTFTNVELRANACRLGSFAVWGNNGAGTNANHFATFPPFSLRAAFNGIMPKRWGVFVAHDSVSALHATGSNHVIEYIPITLQTS